MAALPQKSNRSSVTIDAIGMLLDYPEKPEASPLPISILLNTNGFTAQPPQEFQAISHFRQSLATLEGSSPFHPVKDFAHHLNSQRPSI
jgi:hypothetical protein